MPKIVNKKVRRKEIARSALDVLAEKGVAATSISDIARAAGMGKGTFYDYFETKDDMLAVVVDIILAEWTLAIRRALRGISSPLDQLEAVVRSGAGLWQSFQKFMILYVDLWRCSQTPGGAGFNRQFRDYLLSTRRGIADIVRAGKAEGTVREDVDEEALAVSLIALIDGYCLHHMVFEGEIDARGIAQAFCAILRQGLA